jgi:hypothetical protein
MVVVFLAGGVIWAGSAAKPVDPAGNNGTVKIDGAAFDDHPNNEPHVGCAFQVDFYGFDEGDLNATVTFTAQPPSGQGTVILTDTVFIGEDDHSGGGSEAGLDASETYDLSGLLGGLTEHPQQGFHIKLTVNAPGSQGSDVKHKVFWVKGCGAPPTTTSTSMPTTTTTCPPKQTTTTYATTTSEPST